MSAAIDNYVDIDSATGGPATINVTTPVHNAGDELVVSVHAIPSSAATGNLCNPPALWTVKSRERGVSLNAPEQLTITKIGAGWNGSAGAEGGTIALSTVGGTEGVNTSLTGIAFRVSDHNTELGISLLGSNNSSTTAVESLLVAGGTVPDDTVLLGIVSTRADINNHAASGMSNVHGYVHPASVAAGMSILTQTIAMGADTGSRTFTWTGGARALGILLAIPPAVTPGTTNFSGTPTIAGNEGGYEVDFQLTADGTASAVATKANSSTPTSTQIHAGQNSAGTAAEDADSKTVLASTPSKMNLEPLAFPVYDIHLAASTNVLSYQDQVKDPPTGFQYVEVDLDGEALPSESVLHPSTATGDFLEASTVVLPDDVVINFTPTGGFSLENVVEGRQYFFKRQYDYSSAAWMQFDDEASGEYVTQYINNTPPAEITPLTDVVWVKDVAITPILLDGVYFEDSEGDVLTISMNLPTGVSITRDVDGRNQITGTPTGTASETAVTGTVTDIAGDSINITSWNYTILDSVAVPAGTVGTTDEATIVAAIEGAGLVASVEFQASDTYDAGTLIGLNPPSGTLVAVGSVVNVVISVGYGYVISIEPPIAANNTGSIWPDTEATFNFFPGYTPTSLMAAEAAGVVPGCISGTATSDENGAWSIPVNDNATGELKMHIPYTDPLIDGAGPEDDVAFWLTVTPE